MPLPPAMLNCSVLLRETATKRATMLHPMHRIPFWLATEEGTNMQRAVVLYVQVLMPAAMRFFPAVSRTKLTPHGAAMPPA